MSWAKRCSLVPQKADPNEISDDEEILENSSLHMKNINAKLRMVNVSHYKYSMPCAILPVNYKTAGFRTGIIYQALSFELSRHKGSIGISRDKPFRCLWYNFIDVPYTKIPKRLSMSALQRLATGNLMTRSRMAKNNIEKTVGEMKAEIIKMGLVCSKIIKEDGTIVTNDDNINKISGLKIDQKQVRLRRPRGDNSKNTERAIITESAERYYQDDARLKNPPGVFKSAKNKGRRIISRVEKPEIIGEFRGTKRVKLWFELVMELITPIMEMSDEHWFLVSAVQTLSGAKQRKHSVVLPTLQEVKSKKRDINFTVESVKRRIAEFEQNVDEKKISFNAEFL